MNGERWNPWRTLAAPSPAAPSPSEPILAKRAFAELTFVLAVTFAYFLTRGLLAGRTSSAIANADDILAIERTFHLNPESAMQALALQHSWLMQAANVFYLVGHVPVLVAVAVWLYIRHRWAYRWFRNAFLLSALLGLTIYVVLPVAPPRFLPGFVDTLKVSGINLDGSALGLLYNPDAAMPSLHVGWALLAGVAVFACAHARWLRAAGLALPVLMAAAVLMTGNHYLLDIVAGTIIAMVSLSLIAWRSSRTRKRTDPSSLPAATTWHDDSNAEQDMDNSDALAEALASGRNARSTESTYAIP